MKIQLTKKLIENAKPQPRPYELRDVQVKGLLRVQPSGHKAFICEWTRGKRRTLGAFSALTLEQARQQSMQAVAEYVQGALPAIGKPKVTSCTLSTFLHDRYAPWALTALKSGRGTVERIRASFKQSLNTQLAAIDASFIDSWSAARLTSTNRLGKQVGRVTVARDLASLRSAMTKAVEWKLLASNPLLDTSKKAQMPARSYATLALMKNHGFEPSWQHVMRAWCRAGHRVTSGAQHATTRCCRHCLQVATPIT